MFTPFWHPLMRKRGRPRWSARGPVRLEVLEARTVPSTVVYRSDGDIVPIRNGQLASAEIRVLESFPIGQLRVGLDLSHYYSSDLNAYLVGPDGTYVTLFRKVGGDGDHFTGTFLADAAAGSISGAAAPFTGTFRPEQSLGAFTGKQAAGTWRLLIEDDYFDDDGELLDWSLHFDPLSEYVSTAVPMRIPTTGTAGTIVSSLNVADAFAIDRVMVRLDLTHSWDSDLDVFLVGPDGRRVELFTDVGGDGDHFTGTLLDDTAPWRITQGSAPFSGRFRPEGSLAAFGGSLAQGEWQLEITDDASGDPGQLLGWSLLFNRPTSSAAAPDLAGAAFTPGQLEARWGDVVQIDLAVVNQGGDAGPFTVDIRLSADGTMGGGDLLLGSVHFAGLSAGQTVQQQVSVTLPGSPGAPPAGFSEPGAVTLGMILDTAASVAEWSEANNANRGDRLDRARLRIGRSRESEPAAGPWSNDSKEAAERIELNLPVKGALGRAGDIDFYIFEVASGGYLTAEVSAAAGSSVDTRLELHSGDSLLLYQGMRVGGGGLLVASDDRAAGDGRPLLHQYLMPGRYYLAVAGSLADTGEYTLTSRFEPDRRDPYDLNIEAPSRVQVGDDPRGILTADFNGDSVIDVATVNHGSHSVSVLLGYGDGTFHDQAVYPIRPGATALDTADLNRDGRLDLLALDPATGQVSLLIGLGDGDFLLPALPLDRSDVRLQGRFLAPVPIPGTGTIRVPLQLDVQATITDLDVMLAIGHGHVADLRAVLVSPTGERVELFAGVGGRDDNLQYTVLDDEAEHSIETARAPYAGLRLKPVAPATLATFDGMQAQGTWHLEISDTTRPEVAGTLYHFALSVNHGPFISHFAASLVVGDPTVNPFMLPTVVGDFNRDSVLDVASVSSRTDTAPFDHHLVVLAGAPIGNGATVDLTRANDPQLLRDLFGVSGDTVPVERFLKDYSLLISSDRNPPIPPRATPLVGDLLGNDGIDDVVVVTLEGDILLRRGLPGLPGQFDAAVTVNASPALPRAREVAILSTGTTSRLAALDLRSDQVTVYSLVGGVWQETATVRAGLLPLRIVAGDLDGDGTADLVVGNSILGTVSLFRGVGARFDEYAQVRVGISVADVRLADLDGDHRLEVVATDLAGNVSVLPNRSVPGRLDIGQERRYHTGEATRAHPYGLVEAVSNIANAASRQYSLFDVFPAQFFPFSPHETRQTVAGDFTGDGRSDLVTVNTGTGTLGLLRGKPGGLVDPLPMTIGGTPAALAAAQLNDDNLDGRIDSADHLDLVVLDDRAGTVATYLNDGSGGFREQLPAGETQRLPVGDRPTGLALRDVTRPGGGGPDGRVDLLVGNDFGDLLILAGRGNGSFEPPPYRGRAARLAVEYFDGSDQPTVVVTNQEDNRVTVQTRTASGDPFQELRGFTAGLRTRAPGDIHWVHLDGPADLYPDHVYVASGSNSVVVRRGTGISGSGPEYADAVAYPVGTNPVDVLVADLNDDGILDLVVTNQGSNDVSILFGQRDAVTGGWIARQGPRLASGGLGPVATILRDVDADGVLDLVVTNTLVAETPAAGSAVGRLAASATATATTGETGSVVILPGRGQGFYDDRTPRVIPLPGVPQPQTPINPGGPPILTAGTNGQLFSITFSPTGGEARTVYTAPGGEIRAVGALGDGRLAMVGGGEVRLLELDDDGGYVAGDPLSTRGDQPLDPSALAVLETDSGYQVLVTSAGEDRVFVFEQRPDQPDPGPVDPAPERPPAVAATPLEGESLVLVVTLYAGDLEDASESPDDRSAASGDDSMPGEFAVGGSGNPEESDEEESTESAEPLDLEANLKALDLYRNTEESGEEPPIEDEEPPADEEPPDDEAPTGEDAAAVPRDELFVLALRQVERLWPGDGPEAEADELSITEPLSAGGLTWIDLLAAGSAVAVADAVFADRKNRLTAYSRPRRRR